MRLCIFFFFKQKTAYEMQRGLVGSEMCIRDRSNSTFFASFGFGLKKGFTMSFQYSTWLRSFCSICERVSSFSSDSVSYTHLTLPTILLVQISVVAGSLKKKKDMFLEGKSRSIHSTIQMLAQETQAA
eukprot:TRINITY_DN59385_c0_g2_i1.p3 TRINITY_DN59385_c0_g2~~TRINITY_DN59385_c0_g2_i1.p3  ORF type:complete len:128 (+),score=32.71 TRINITY_DN59385_c0_g2_i1:79-462(+)